MNELLQSLFLYLLINDQVTSPLGTLCHGLLGNISENGVETLSDNDLTELLSTKLVQLTQEEKTFSSKLDRLYIARDKLQGELDYIERQINDITKSRELLREQKYLSKLSLNAMISGEVICDNKISAKLPFFPTGKNVTTSVTNKETKLPLAGSDSLNDNNSSKYSKKNLISSSDIPPNISNSRDESPNAEENLWSMTGKKTKDPSTILLKALQYQSLDEPLLLNTLVNYEQQMLMDTKFPENDFEIRISCEIIELLIQKIFSSSPPTQCIQIRILTLLAKRNISIINSTFWSCDIAKLLIQSIQSISDEVKYFACDCLIVICNTTEKRRVFLSLDGLKPLMHIIVKSTVCKVLERALVFLCHILALENTERASVRLLGGARALTDLLFTDSIAILDNVAMALSYMTREEGTRLELLESGLFERIVITLRHPSPLIQFKLAGAIWNCACAPESREALRNLGCPLALVELLSTSNESVLECATGALWNISADARSKIDILNYGGIPLLLSALRHRNKKVVENASGALWNCSASPSVRPVIRECDGFLLLLQMLRDKATPSPIQDNIAGILRNCVINDQNKSAIKEAGGVEILIELLERCLSEPTMDRIAMTLCTLTVDADIKHTVRTCNGIRRLTSLLCSEKIALNTREKILGVLHNCATVPENRQAMNHMHVVEELVYMMHHITGSHTSIQLKKTLCSTLWYLSRDDSDVVRSEGGFDLMVEMLKEPPEVSKEAAGALSSLVSGNDTNKRYLLSNGGLTTLFEIFTRYSSDFFSEDAPENTLAVSSTRSTIVLHLLLSLRHSSAINSIAVKFFHHPGVVETLLNIIDDGTEECACEAAMCLTHLAIPQGGREFLENHHAFDRLTALSKRATTMQCKRATVAASTALRGQK